MNYCKSNKEIEHLHAQLQFITSVKLWYTLYVLTNKNQACTAGNTIGLNLSQNASWFRGEAEITHLHGIHN